MGQKPQWAVLLLVLIGAAPVLLADVSADQLTKAGHWKRARTVVEAALKQNPRDAHLLMLMARVQRAYGKLDEAQRSAEQAVAIDPKSWEAHWELGQVYAEQINKVSFLKKMGMAGNIRKEFEAAEAATANQFETHYALMSFYMEAPGMAGGDKNKARAEQMEVAKLSPAWGYLAELDLTPKDKRAAAQEELYRKAHDAARAEEYSSLVPYCNFLAAQKRWEEAEKCSADLVKRAADRVTGYSLLAVIYASQSRWKELDSVIAEAEKNVPDNLNPEFQAARTLAEAGMELPRAERYLRNYLKQEPEPKYPLLSRAHYRLGQVLAKNGSKAEAIAELEMALKLEPDLKPAAEELKKLQ